MGENAEMDQIKGDVMRKFLKTAHPFSGGCGEKGPCRNTPHLATVDEPLQPSSNVQFVAEFGKL